MVFARDSCLTYVLQDILLIVERKGLKDTHANEEIARLKRGELAERMQESLTDGRNLTFLVFEFVMQRPY